MSSLPRLLIYGRDSVQTKSLQGAAGEQFDVIQTDSMERVLEQLRTGGYTGVCLIDPNIEHLCGASLLPHSGGILSQLDDGVAVLDLKLRVVWCNQRFQELSGREGCLVDQPFSDLFTGAVLPGADPTPFHTAIETNSRTRTQMRQGDYRFLQVHVTPVAAAGKSDPAHFVVLVRDISAETLRQQKLSAIFEAGLELGDMSPEDLREMSVENRVELLKSQIISCTEGVLQYETVEIRLLDPETNRLNPLLNVGMLPEAAERVLMALPEGNGVTGFVAANGQSYLCADSEHDPRYLKGAAGARSSLTVPLKWHDHILGTFNVESRQAGAFSMQDLQFLELFGLEVAVALNRLNLLTAEKISTATENTGRILCEVAQPVDDVLNDAAWILDKYIGHDPEVVQRLQKILQHARDIKQCIRLTSEELAPLGAGGALPSIAQRGRLKGKRVLVADNDQEIRQKSLELLAPHGCEVETAHNGEDAILMAKMFPYDALLADIRLPDMSGFECFRRVREVRPELPIILMTGFGYDPGHSIVKAREQGLKAVLYKPFRQEMFLDEVEKAANGYGAKIVNQGSSAGTTAADPQKT